MTFSNADVKFAAQKLTWRTYIIAEALPTTKQIELINKKEFAKAELDEQSETIVVYVAALETLSESAKMTIYPS